MSFKSKFIEYSKLTVPTFLWKDEKILKNYIKSYSNSDFDFLIKQIEWYWIKSEKDQILRRNLYAVIEALLPKFTLSNKKKLAQEFSKKILFFQNKWITYSDYFYELRLLILLDPSKNAVLSVYKNEKAPHAFWYFFDYCIKNDDREFFIDAMIRYVSLYEVTYSKEEFRYFDLRSQENLDYILKDSNTINKFLELLSNNPNALFSLIDGYNLSEEKIVKVFSDWDNVFSQKNIEIVIKKYYEDRSFEIDRIIKSSLFISILWTQKNDAEFVKNVFDYINNESRQYYTITKSVLIWLLSYELIDLFFQYNRGVWTVLSFYYSLSEKDVQQKKIKEVIYNKYKEIIENNNKKNEEYREQDEKRLNEEERKVKEDIYEIISEITKLENTTKEKYFSSRILYLYKNYKELFEENQIPFVKKQINLYFTSNKTNPWSQYAKVDISWWNQFSRPRFISDLELCIEISILEGWNIGKYIERIIYLIPYLFDSEYEKLVKFFNVNKIIIDDKRHINRLLKVYNHESDHWKLWYLHPYRIISLFNDNILCIDVLTKGQKEKLSKICEKMVKTDNERVSMREKESYIKFIIKESEYLNYLWIEEYNNELLSRAWNYNYYEDYLRNKIKKDDVNDFEMLCHTNGALIEISKNKGAIQRRLNQLKWIKTDYVDIMKNWVVHWVTPIENEIIRWRHENKFFYTPLLNAIKYDDYENDILEILDNAKTFKSDNSEIKKYLYRFVASYYKTVSSKKKINVYAWINNKEFVIYYLWAAYWSEDLKEKYINRSKKLKEKEKVKRKTLKIDELKKENGDLIKKYKSLQKEKHELILDNYKLKSDYIKLEQNNKFLKYKNNDLEEEILKLKNKIIIFTEWKTDWKHMLRMARELKKIFPKKYKIYDFFINNIKQYNYNDMWWETLSIFIEKLAWLYPEFKVIWILDTDGDKKIMKNWIPLVNSDNCHIYKKTDLNNLRLVTLTEPWHYGELKNEYYNEHKWCTELFYSRKKLKNKLITPRDIDSIELTKKFGVTFDKIKFWRKILYIKNFRSKDCSNILDHNSNSIFDIKWDPYNQIISKDDFSNFVLNWDIKFSKKDIIVFNPLFEIIYNAYIDMINK